jgi:hypothetical protein
MSISHHRHCNRSLCFHTVLLQTFRIVVLLLIGLIYEDNPASADFLIRIGDIDGFGYGAAPGFQAANGGPANVNEPGVLTNLDFLPDITGNGGLATESNDQFDLRSAEELADTANALGLGVTNAVGTVGSAFTDISLATTYGAARANNQVLIGGNPTTSLVYGSGGPFPRPPSNELPNQPGFVFSFDIDKSIVSPPAGIFFNLIFGDYDVTPARIRITRADASSELVSLRRQNTGQDGLVQAATAELAFSDVFTDIGAVYHGYIKVDFEAPNEPYTAFDYVELSTIAIEIPEPTSAAFAMMIAMGMFAVRRRHR